MKTPLTYGTYTALASGLLLLLLFFTGFHAPERFFIGLVAQFVLGLVILIAGLFFAMREQRSINGAKVGLSYGQAFKTGILTAVVASAIGVVFNLTYSRVINPAYQTAAVEWTAAMMERNKVPDDKIEEMREKASQPKPIVREAVFGLLGGILFGALCSLVVAAIVKKAPVEDLSDSENQPPLPA